MGQVYRKVNERRVNHLCIRPTKSRGDRTTQRTISPALLASFSRKFFSVFRCKYGCYMCVRHMTYVNGLVSLMVRLSWVGGMHRIAILS